jgi:hypothetical protein
VRGLDTLGVQVVALPIVDSVAMVVPPIASRGHEQLHASCFGHVFAMLVGGDAAWQYPSTSVSFASPSQLRPRMLRIDLRVVRV